MRFPILIAAVFAAALCAPAMAHEHESANIQIDKAWARVTFSSAVPAAVYFDVANHGAEGDRLLSATTEIAEAVELHESAKDDDGVMTMRKLDGLDVPAHETVSLESGAYHVMLIGLEAPLAEGDSFPLVLTFEKAGEVEVTIDVKTDSPEAETHHGHH